MRSVGATEKKQSMWCEWAGQHLAERALKSEWSLSYPGATARRSASSVQDAEIHRLGVDGKSLPRIRQFRLKGDLTE